MTDCKLRMLWVLLAGIAGSTVAQAQTPAALIYDPRVGAINFAAGNLKAALVQNGYAVADLPLGDPSGATQSVCQILLQRARGGTLQTATTVPGPWSDVSGATSPFSADTTNPAQFFLVRQ